MLYTLFLCFILLFSRRTECVIPTSYKVDKVVQQLPVAPIHKHKIVYKNRIRQKKFLIHQPSLRSRVLTKYSPRY